MKKVVILGAGGLGRQVLAQLQTDYAFGLDWLVEGFIDERGPEVVSEALYYPWLGYPETFVPTPEHFFVVAVGDTASREAQIKPLLEKQANFIAVRTRCLIGARNSFGPTFFGYDVTTGVDCTIGAYCFIDQQAMVGHDVTLGDYVHIGPRALLAGNVTVNKGATIHSGAMISRGITVGEGAVVGMGAVVFKDVPPGATVMGNPARIIFQK